MYDSMRLKQEKLSGDETRRDETKRRILVDEISEVSNLVMSPVCLNAAPGGWSPSEP